MTEEKKNETKKDESPPPIFLNTFFLVLGSIGTVGAFHLLALGLSFAGPPFDEDLRSTPLLLQGFGLMFVYGGCGLVLGLSLAVSLTAIGDTYTRLFVPESRKKLRHEIARAKQLTSGLNSPEAGRIMECLDRAEDCLTNIELIRPKETLAEYYDRMGSPPLLG